MLGFYKEDECFKGNLEDDYMEFDVCEDIIFRESNLDVDDFSELVVFYYRKMNMF